MPSCTVMPIPAVTATPTTSTYTLHARAIAAYRRAERTGESASTGRLACRTATCETVILVTPNTSRRPVTHDTIATQVAANAGSDRNRNSETVAVMPVGLLLIVFPVRIVSYLG